MKVKEIKDWKVIHFADRSILRSGLKYMSKDQIERLNNMNVVPDICKGHYSSR